uniref:Uncharacterized protein n=1 Tax=Trichogramma kaykai TaxID=54128 RepID=A0ABD2WJ27_9HYME
MSQLRSHPIPIKKKSHEKGCKSINVLDGYLARLIDPKVAFPRRTHPKNTRVNFHPKNNSTNHRTFKASSLLGSSLL